MNSKIIASLIAAVSLATLSGCVVVVDGRDDGEVKWASTWEAENKLANEANQELAKKVSLALAADESLAGDKISVSARRGAIALHGSVTSTDAVNRAMQLAAGVPGVTSVVSRLSVEFPVQ